ncbi:hypothetical protein LX77_02887 [Gelidibacter algens]|uniref:DISARM protein DrmE C-terminal domain-containing protein n=1 Tax=Gelidibacter algens TaxID=49280 RepID=A0A1A7QNE7_9FLAO|nr:hypothetical protein [Gelidibacter algens]OBX21585.1 hypothetical protein A9996_17955 [Gelidibacter algens]RAJ21133.1 hypothetical protein LX77_02887 [Gelidibacter algens]
MQEIKTYTQELLTKAKKYLTKEYNLEALNVSDFQAINFYLMDVAINKEDNLFIESFHKELPALSQFPAVLSIAISLFYKNYCDNHTIYEVGDVLQRDRRRYKILQVSKEFYTVIGGKKDEEFRGTIRHKDIEKYRIVTGQRTGRRVKVGFNHYAEFYKKIFNEESHLPSQFKYKAAIIMSKKEFDEELRTQKYIDIDIKKAIPMRWIARSGSESWNHIPIEPMIYCVPDYDTLQTYVLDKGIAIETLIVIGKNRYKDEVSTRIRLALRNEEILNCIILGSEGFNDQQNQFLKWKWTASEFEYLEKKEPGLVIVRNIEDVNYQNKIDDFMQYLRTLEKDNAISLVNVKRLRRFLYALVLAKHENSRNLSQLEFIQHLIKTVASETIEQEFYDLGIDDSEIQLQIRLKIDEIFNNFNNNKLKYLDRIKNIQFLIVPDRLVENWKDEFEGSHHKVISLNEFKKIQNKIDGNKNVYLLSIYNNGMFYDEVLHLAINAPHRISFLAYPEEAQVINNYIDKYKNSLITEYRSRDRKKLTGLDFNMGLRETIENKSLDDIMDGFYQRNERSENVYDYESNKQVNYRFRFEGYPDSLVYDGSKTILINKDGRWVKSKTYNVLPGDIVRIYSNLSKERLFDIASQEDKNNRFGEVEIMSRLWKKTLLRYYSERAGKDRYYDRDRLLSSLKAHGSKITNSITISKWLNESDKEKFPHSNNELKAIKQLVDDEELNNAYATLLRAKGFYRGLMISLGRDLSDDVMDYIISEGTIKGRMLSKFENEEILSFVKSAAPVRTIATKAITEDEESN